MLHRMHSMYEADLAMVIAAKPETDEQWTQICRLENQIKDIEEMENSENINDRPDRS